MYFFTADEHYGHSNIIEFCLRPFEDVVEMDEVLISNHNKVVTDKDVTVHVGDFSLSPSYKNVMERYVNQLNGRHIFITGSHDYWLKKNKALDPEWDKTKNGRFRDVGYMWEKDFSKDQSLDIDAYVVACHYACRVWPRSHFGSLQAYGHSHSELLPEGNQWDVGVDNNNFIPISIIELQKIIKRGI